MNHSVLVYGTRENARAHELRARLEDAPKPKPTPAPVLAHSSNTKPAAA